MNLLERKRYKYYKNRLPLAPTYFSCGIFNIVRHCEDFNCINLFFTPIAIDEDLDNIKLLNGKPVYIDYGDFNTYQFNSLCIGYIDYK